MSHTVTQSRTRDNKCHTLTHCPGQQTTSVTHCHTVQDYRQQVLHTVTQSRTTDNRCHTLSHSLGLQTTSVTHCHTVQGYRQQVSHTVTQSRTTDNKCHIVVKASSYIAQYPVLRTVQSALHFTSLTDLFTQTPSQLLREASSHMLQLIHEDCSYTYPPLSIGRYSFIQLSELEQCRVKKLDRGFNTAAQDSNPGSRSRESEALPLSHGTLQSYCAIHCHQG